MDPRGSRRRYVEFFLVHLGWDSALIDPADLEVTHEELLDGELVHSTRLRLEDLDLSAIAGKDACTVRLPSVGRRVAHGVTLSTVDGELIDRSGPYPLVERVEMTLVVDGHEMPAIRSGDDEPLPGIERRTDRTRQIAADMRAVLASAAAAR